MMALSGCSDDYLLTEGDTHPDEYTVRYNVTYSTTFDFHNIAYISFTDFFDRRDGSRYTGKPTHIERRIDGTEDFVTVRRVPRGATVEFSTYVDVTEALPNTKVEISIEVSKKGGGSPYTEVAKATAECPLKGTPLTVSYTIPSE